MDKVDKFEEFKKRIEKREKKVPKIKGKYSEDGHCLGQCDRKVITDESGQRKIVCDYCNRVVYSL